MNDKFQSKRSIYSNLYDKLLDFSLETQDSPKDRDGILQMKVAQVKQSIHQFKLKDSEDFLLMEKHQNIKKDRSSHQKENLSLFIIQEEKNQQDEEYLKYWRSSQFKINDNKINNLSTIPLRKQDSSSPTAKKQYSNIFTNEWLCSPQSCKQAFSDFNFQRKTIKRDISKILTENETVNLEQSSNSKCFFDSSFGRIVKTDELKSNEVNIFYQCTKEVLKRTMKQLRKEGIFINFQTEEQENKQNQNTNETEQRLNRKGIKILTKKKKL